MDCDELGTIDARLTVDACSICRTVDIDVILHTGFMLYVRKSVDALRFVVLYCIVV